jgi:nitroimidazol reductase NimA-like FMN-containing flavoprotein (pyridoxamine 5'-phosphate oxidase superfamily)
MVAIPQGFESLVKRPLFGHLATVRPDGNPQVTPMWSASDGEVLRFTHTTERQKYHVAISVSKK